MALLWAAQTLTASDSPAIAPVGAYKALNLEFSAHDGVAMFGRLVLPASGAPRAIVLYVQTAEGATIDMKRPLGSGRTFNYYDLYRDKLTTMQIGFFSYEGRGIRMGDSPPRYETIDPEIYETSTLENKVRDVLSAVEAVRNASGLGAIPIILMGASEGTLLAAEAAARQPEAISGLVLYGVLAANLRETFAYIMSDGEFLRYRILDTSGDGVVSREEWETMVKTSAFSDADLDRDGRFTVADVRVATKPYLDAVANDDYDTLQAWAKSRAAVSVPSNWFRDHFDHADIWTFLSQLEVPVGCFHGELDRMTPVAAVRELAEQAERSGLAKMEFHYFTDLDHTLNIGQFFYTGDLPEGHRAIFSFIDRVVSGDRAVATKTPPNPE